MRLYKSKLEKTNDPNDEKQVDIMNRSDQLTEENKILRQYTMYSNKKKCFCFSKCLKKYQSYKGKQTIDLTQ